MNGLQAMMQNATQMSDIIPFTLDAEKDYANIFIIADEANGGRCTNSSELYTCLRKDAPTNHAKDWAFKYIAGNTLDTLKVVGEWDDSALDESFVGKILLVTIKDYKNLPTGGN